MNIVKQILLSLTVLISINGFAQERSTYNRYFAKDKLSFSFNSTQWLQSDSEVQPSPFSCGFTTQLMYPFLGNRGKVALAVGFGFAAQNYYLNSFLNTNSDSVWFTPIADSLNTKKYKLNTNYLTIPFEIRFRTNPNQDSKSYKLYVGMRLGILVNSHTKYVGKDPITNDKVKEKQYYIKHIEPIDYGLTLRFGRGDVMVHGYYSLSALFNTNKIEKITPVEMGITLILF